MSMEMPVVIFYTTNVSFVNSLVTEVASCLLSAGMFRLTSIVTSVNAFGETL